jgi:hypothetical protein
MTCTHITKSIGSFENLLRTKTDRQTDRSPASRLILRATSNGVHANRRSAPQCACMQQLQTHKRLFERRAEVPNLCIYMHVREYFVHVLCPCTIMPNVRACKHARMRVRLCMCMFTSGSWIIALECATSGQIGMCMCTKSTQLVACMCLVLYVCLCRDVSVSCTYINAHEQFDAHTHTHTHTCKKKFMYSHTYIRMQNKCVHSHAYIHTEDEVHVQSYTHTAKPTSYTPTHIHTYKIT